MYSAANDPRPQMIPRPEMIPKLDRKWSQTANDPLWGPQMIPAGKKTMARILVSWIFFLIFFSLFFSSTKKKLNQIKEKMYWQHKL